MLQDKLEEALFDFQLKSNISSASIIIMHPLTWMNLQKEVFSTYSTAINRYDMDILKYRGIKVIRTLDQIEGLFEIR